MIQERVRERGRRVEGLAIDVALAVLIAAGMTEVVRFLIASF